MDLSFGLALSAINFALIFSLVLARRPTLSTRIMPIFALSLVLVCIPVAGIAPIYFLRAAFGDFSITATLLLAVLAFCNVRSSKVPRRDIFCLAAILAPLALWFYPLSLGITLHDPYQLGYNATVLSIVLLAAGLLAWLRAYFVVVAILSLDLLAYHFEVLESNNLWDYLIDPCLAIFALYHVPSALLSRRAKATAKSEDEEHDHIADDGRVVKIKGQALRRKKPIVACENNPDSEQHGYRYADPSVLGATAAAKKAK
ncbi:MAG: hypothetical protein ACI89D_001175 [Bermanella sp.]|jgi:hypothetical protein